VQQAAPLRCMYNKKKTIFFDAVGTLFEVDQGVGFQYSRIALKFGVRQNPALLDQRFYEAFKTMPPLDFPDLLPNLLEQTEKAWWRTLVQHVFQDTIFPDFDSFFEALYSFFAGNSGEETPWTLFLETKEVLGHLSQLGYSLGIISNFDSRLQPVVTSLGIAHFFQTVTCSAQEGIAKPDQAIFKRAMEKAGCLPSNAIYIGNDPHDDGVGAKSAGIFFLLIDRKGREKVDTEQDRNVITDLREISNYL